MVTGGGGSNFGEDIGRALHDTTKNRCDHPAITRPSTVARLVIDGSCLLFAVLLLWLWVRTRRRLPSVKSLLPWYTYGTLLGLTALYLTLGLVLTTLKACFVTTSSSTVILGALANAASGIADLVLLQIVFYSLTRRLLRLGGCQTRFVSMLNLVGLSLSTTAFLPTTVLSTVASIFRLTSGHDPTSKSLLANLSIYFSAAFYTSYFAEILVGSATLVFAASRPDPGTIVPSKSYPLIGCTIGFLLIGSGSAVAQMFAYSLPSRRLPDLAWVLFLAIFNVCFMLATFTVLQIARAIAVPVVDPKGNSTCDSEASEAIRAVVHKRCTHVCGADIQLPRHTHLPKRRVWLPAVSNSPNSSRWRLSSPLVNLRSPLLPTRNAQYAF
ncbi:uncharacterized protein PV09_01016 [Verruconis gallopava]|uniref:Uncharacterized protein n=1 Tax=Verruconis gallopava TaxID=253628 RepID=A0A0D2AN01_9PEZI|nr:uncharacterized protein PV09_01016 [Verruconis gallopava]KIW08078.1 hypothetical protein PV09_01016 [Verruconis gallopava]